MTVSVELLKAGFTLMIVLLIVYFIFEFRK